MRNGRALLKITHARARARAHTHTHTHTQLRTYTHTHTHTHTHKREHKKDPTTQHLKSEDLVTNMLSIDMITNRPEVLSMFQCVWVPLLPLHILKRMLLANYHRKQPLKTNVAC